MTSKPLRLPGLALVLLLTCLPSLNAADLRFISWAVSDENLQFANGAKATELSVPDEAFSPAYKFTGAAALTLYKMVEGDPKPLKRTACTIPLPETMTRGLVILIPQESPQPAQEKVIPNSLGVVSSKAPMTYSYMLLDDSVEARPLGTIEFRNFTGLPLALQVENQQFTLSPDPTVKHQVPLVAGARRLFYRAAAQINGKWEIVGSNPLSTRGPPDRMMVILKTQSAGDLPPTAASIRTLVIADWTRAEPAPFASNGTP